MYKFSYLTCDRKREIEYKVTERQTQKASKDTCVMCDCLMFDIGKMASSAFVKEQQAVRAEAIARDSNKIYSNRNCDSYFMHQ